MQVTDANRAAMWRSLEDAPTLCENLFWAALLGLPGGWGAYFKELNITDLYGPGCMPDNFAGEP